MTGNWLIRKKLIRPIYNTETQKTNTSIVLINLEQNVVFLTKLLKNLIALIFGLNVLNQVNNSVRITIFIVVPRHQLDKLVTQLNPSLCIKNWRKGTANEIRRNYFVFSVVQDSLQRTSSSFFYFLFNGIIGSWLSKSKKYTIFMYLWIFKLLY